MASSRFHHRRNSRSTASGCQRRGSVTIWSLMVMVIGLAMMMLVVNWTYLVLVNRHTLRLTDILALSAVEQLLDEGRLADLPLSQGNDVAAAQSLILDPNVGLLKRNNDGAGSSLRPQANASPQDNEVLVTAGRIEQPSLPVGGGNGFSEVGSPLNTLRVEVLRKTTGNNPVQLLLRGFGSPDSAPISAASFASLDSRVIGFRPRADVNAPVVPLAILNSSWQNGRNILGTQGRMQLDIFLNPVKTTSPAEPLNGALIGLSGNGFSATVAATQIQNGVTVNDVGGMLGPVYPGSASLPLDGIQSTPANAATLASHFNAIAASNRPVRAFPLYSSFSGGQARVIGFVGARVVAAAVENKGNGNRLRVRVEPAFLIHNTVETGLGNAPSSVPENIYIHKIRLTR